MDPQYFPRGPAPMIRERELAESCLRNVFQSSDILRNRSNFLRYMDQITNEVLGIQQEKIRKEQETAAKKAHLIQQQQIRQTITDDMRMASSTSLHKLRHLRESMRENPVGSDIYSPRFSNSFETNNHGDQQQSHPQQSQSHQQQEFQYGQNNTQSNHLYPNLDGEYGTISHHNAESHHQQTYNPHTSSLQEQPQATQPQMMLNPTHDYQYAYYHPEESPHHQQQQVFAPQSRAQAELMQETTPLKPDTKIVSPPKPISNNNTIPSSNFPLQESDPLPNSKPANIPVASLTKSTQSPPQQLSPAGNKFAPSVSTAPASNTNASQKAMGVVGSSQTSSYTPANVGMGNFDLAGKTPMPPSKGLNTATVAANAPAKLTLSQTAIQPPPVSSSNSVSAEPSPPNQVQAPGTNTSSTGSRRRFSIGEEDWDEEGSAFTPTSPKLLGSHRKSISSNNKVIPSPARRPSTDSSQGKISGTSTPVLNTTAVPPQPPTTAAGNAMAGASNSTSNPSGLVKPPTMSLERPLSAGKARSGNTATVLATATAPAVTSAAKDAGHASSQANATNAAVGPTRNQRALSGDHSNSHVVAPSNSAATGSATLPPKPMPTTSVKLVSTTTQPKTSRSRSSSRSSESSDEFSDLEDIDGDESHVHEDAHSETMRSVRSEKAQPPLSAAMMASVINHSHPQLLQLTSRNNSDSDNRVKGQEEQQHVTQHKVPLHHPPVPRPLTPVNIGRETSLKTDVGKGKATGEIDLSWDKFRESSLQNKVTDSPNNSDIVPLPNFLPHSGHTIAAEVATTGQTVSSNKMTFPEEADKIVAAEYARLSRELEALRHKIPGARLPAIMQTESRVPTSTLPPLYSDKDYSHVTRAPTGDTKNANNMPANNLTSRNDVNALNTPNTAAVQNNNNNNNNYSNPNNPNNTNNNNNNQNYQAKPTYPLKSGVSQNEKSNANQGTGDALRESIDLSSLSLQRIRELTGHY